MFCTVCMQNVLRIRHSQQDDDGADLGVVSDSDIVSNVSRGVTISDCQPRHQRSARRSPMYVKIRSPRQIGYCLS